MNKLIAALCFITFNLFSFNEHSVVSYQVTPGRFGDNLLNYLHAKWFSYKHDLPLIYRPFPYSDLLVLDAQEFYYKNKQLRKNLGLKPPFKTKIKHWPLLSKLPFFTFNYVCNYFPESQWECQHLKYSSFPVHWKDPTFRKMAKELISPKEQLCLTKPPSGVISIAIHVREGGGFDVDQAKLIMPLKLPPLDFYIEGLHQILALLPDKPIYCYLFTDARNPEKIVETLKQSSPENRNISFDFRKENNHHELNVLEDFFSLFEFDVLIRSESNYSLIPSLLHDYAIVYFPKNCTTENSSIKITEVEIEINQPIYKKLYEL